MTHIEREEDMSGDSGLLHIITKEHRAWMRAYEKHERNGDGVAAESCLVGANAIEQLLKKLRKEVRNDQ